MDYVIQTFPILLEIDRSTYLMIGLYCSWACYILKARLENAAWLVFLYPLFWAGAVTAYSLMLYFGLFNPKQHREWIVFTVTASAAGCAFGIALVGLFRRFQEGVIDKRYQKQLEVRAADELASLEQQQRAMNSDPVTRSA